jgi:hypothetical protein
LLLVGVLLVGVLLVGVVLTGVLLAGVLLVGVLLVGVLLVVVGVLLVGVLLVGVLPPRTRSQRLGESLGARASKRPSWWVTPTSPTRATLTAKRPRMLRFGRE